MEQHKNYPYYISQWQGFSNGKCPRCRVGNAFIGSTYGFKAQKMNEECPHCGLKFERELGYFYVAMFVSYAMNVAEILTVTIAAYMLGLEPTEENLWYYIGVLFITTVIFAPFNYRYSRLILLYWLSPGLHYEPHRSAPKSNEQK